MMKKVRIMVIAMLVLLLLPTTAFAKEAYRTVEVEVDGAKLETPGYMVDGRTLAPLRAIFERLSATLEWNSADRSVTAVKGNTEIRLWVGKTEAKVGERSVAIDVPPMTINGSVYVPLRFISEAMGADILFDKERFAVVVTTGNACSAAGGTVHDGTILAGGETWNACGSPHYVTGEFLVEGKNSPNLVIEAGAVVRFENGAAIRVGANAPGGLVAEGTKESPVVFTADTAGAEPGFWHGIHFGEQTVKGRALLEHVRIEYAGGLEGAVGVESYGAPVEVTLRNVEWKGSLYAALSMREAAGLTKESGDLKIAGTKASSDGGGVPIMTGIYGTHMLPAGDYKGNDSDVVLITSNNSQEVVTRNTTWTDLGVPYLSVQTVAVHGAANPTLTIRSGTEVVWQQYTALSVGSWDRGGLLVEGTATDPVVFTSETGRPGSWYGIEIGEQAGGKNLNISNAVIEYADRGIYMAADMGPVVTDTVFRNNKEYGILIYTGGEDAVLTDYESGYGNEFIGNGANVGTE